MQQDHSDDIDHTLLDEEEFLALMEAEYQNLQLEPKAEDFDKYRTWLGLKKKIRRQSTTKFSWQKQGVALVASVILVFFAFLMLDREPGSDMQYKGEGFPIEIDLQVLILTADGHLQRAAQLEIDQTLVFQVSLQQQGYIALLMQINALGPELAFVKDESVAGHEILLQSGQNAYGYRVSPSDSDLRFCAVAAIDRYSLDGLVAKLKDSSQDWQSLNSSQCQEFNLP